MPLTAPAIAVRLRRLWAGEIVPSGELRASSLGDAWREWDLVREGPTLILIGPSGRGGALTGPLGELLARRARSVSGGAVTAVTWRDSRRSALVRRDRPSDEDVFGVHDPLLDRYPDIVADLRSAVPTDTPPAARVVLGALRLVGASQHRLWFAARTAADRDALGPVPGARAALFLTVRTYQEAKRPLHHGVVDDSYRATGQLLVPVTTSRGLLR